ncbi:xylulokinase [Novosphingobium sediminicola]|uniref:Xylulose kinase n=1 Tax=Novosphingobium sediminicola TaxID=563162 RepID=A0A7W6CKB5_9SPHN|nr:xylulokinase [Novosphingobium sediminicola]MBB3957392.1 xylulokinase [Novosphingobium sediminicola]
MFLGIDIGTSGVKAVVTASDGRVLSQCSAALSVSRPQELWSQQAPDDWVDATHRAVLGLDAGLRRAVAAIGLAGQMHGATLLGADDRPLRPAILWNDGRSHAQCAALEAAEPQSRAITGNIAMPGFTAPKLLWVHEHEPKVFAATKTVLLPKDYVRLALTGEKASDMSDAAGTLWLDVARRAWSEAMLGATGLTLDHMPRLYEGPQITGHLRAEVAAQWSMETVPVVAGAGDNAAGALGVGVTGEGQGMLSLGTSGVIFVAGDAFRPNPARAVHAFCHALPGVWHQMSVHLSAASCIDWAASACQVPGPAEFFALAESAGPCAGPELFLPYLSGERTPHNDPHLRAGFVGLSHETTTARLAAAVLEGVAFAHADGIDALREAGTQIEELAVIGGGSRSLHWGHILASVLGVRLLYLEGGEVGPALGAARLAQLGTGGDPASICTRPPIRAAIEPDLDLAARLAPQRQRFQRATWALRQLQEKF